MRRAAFVVVAVAWSGVMGAWGSPARAAAQFPGPLYAVDGAHSAVGFSGRYMAIVDVHGTIPDVRGTLVYVPDAIERSSITVILGTASLNTGHKQRDADLRGPDFFDVARYPTIRFISRRVIRRGEGLLMTGDLTVRNVTREVTVRFSQIHPPVKDALGVTRVGFAGRARISRLEFGVVGSRLWNTEFSPGRFAIGDSVDIDLTLEAKLGGLEIETPAGNAGRPIADSLFAVEAARGPLELAAALRTIRTGGSRAYDLSLASLAALSERLRAAGRAEGAVEVARAATELFAGSADAHELLALAQADAGARNLALASAERALAIDPLRTVSREVLRWLGTP